MREYDIHSWEFSEKYTHACIMWYICRHKAEMDGTVEEYDAKTFKPLKTWNERVDLTKNQVIEGVSLVKDNFFPAVNKLRTIVGEKASVATEVGLARTASFRENVSEQPWAQKVSAGAAKAWSWVPAMRSNADRTASMDEGDDKYGDGEEVVREG